MDISKIAIGKNPPHDVNVIVEIPLGGVPVKYEVDKASGAMFVDRFLHTAMYYPANYGFIPHTLSEDGDPVDVLVLGNVPVVPGSVMRSRPVGVMLMEDEKGPDEKVLAVPVDDLHPYYNNIASYKDVREVLLHQIEHFFTRYKDLEKGKEVTLGDWGGPDVAERLILQSIRRAEDGFELRADLPAGPCAGAPGPGPSCCARTPALAPLKSGLAARSGATRGAMISD